MRSVIFAGLATMAFAPSVAQTTSPTQSPTQPSTQVPAQSMPGQTQAMPGQPQSMPGSMQPGQTQPGQAQTNQMQPGQAPGQATASATTNTVVAGDVTPQLTAGAKVFDTKGGEVGTIEEVKDAMVVISTGTAKATLANTAFARGSIGPVIAMTKAEVEDAVKKAQSGANTPAETPSGR